MTRRNLVVITLSLLFLITASGSFVIPENDDTTMILVVISIAIAIGVIVLILLQKRRNR